MDSRAFSNTPTKSLLLSASLWGVCHLALWPAFPPPSSFSLTGVSFHKSLHIQSPQLASVSREPLRPSPVSLLSDWGASQDWVRTEHVGRVKYPNRGQVGDEDMSHTLRASWAQMLPKWRTAPHHVPRSYPPCWEALWYRHVSHPNYILHADYVYFCTIEMDPICCASGQIYSSEFVYSEMMQGV